MLMQLAADTAFALTLPDLVIVLSDEAILERLAIPLRTVNPAVGSTNPLAIGSMPEWAVLAIGF